MKVAQSRIEAVLRAPDPALRAVLVYGPDAGLVRERAERLVRAVAGEPDDPFRVAELTPKDLAEDPARLGDEAAALPFTGGRRVVRLRGADDDAAGALEALLATPGAEGLVVLEAGELAARSALRKAAEGAKAAAAIACYRDDAASLGALVREVLGAEGLAVEDEALAYLTAHLGGDRQQSRRELEKLALYVGGAAAGGRRVALADAEACVGDSAEITLEDLAFAVAGGDAAGAERALERAVLAGAAAVTVLRAVARHLQRLHLVAGGTARGGAPEAAMRALRPPVFWKRTAAFKAQARAWSPAALGQALARLLEAEAACKQTGAPDRALCARTLLEIAVKAPGTRPSRAGATVFGG